MSIVIFKFAMGQEVWIKGSGKTVKITQQCIDSDKVKTYCFRYFTSVEGLPEHQWINEKDLEEIKKVTKKPAKKRTAKKSGRINHQRF